MTSQIEQWSLIFTVILPSMYYVGLCVLLIIDDKRGC